MPNRPRKIAYLTAGAAGMICGSCLHDNTLARAMIALGHDVQLVPLYTPIRTDEEDVSIDRVFFGGINLYLQQKVPLFRWLPKWLDRWLDRPWLINWASRGSIQIEPEQVADLTVSLLRGREGFQRKEVERLAEWLSGDLQPDVIVFSNILTAGCVPEIKRRMNVPVIVTLQGDDIFLRDLPEPQQTLALVEIRRLAEHIDGFIVHSRFYADAMAQYLGLPRERMSIVPLGVDMRDFEKREVMRERPAMCPPTIGYLARIAPEKGLHVLADAFVLLRQMPGMERTQLYIAGWIGDKHEGYESDILDRLRSAGLGDDSVHIFEEVDRRFKLDFLSWIDVLAVPTTYQEPKGLFALEALAAGVPVVLPDHGAFPEMLADTRGGLLHRPNDPQHLAERLYELLTDADLRQRLAETGRRAVRTSRSARQMAERTLDVLAAVAGRGSGVSEQVDGHSTAPVVESTTSRCD